MKLQINNDDIWHLLKTINTHLVSVGLDFDTQVTRLFSVSAYIESNKALHRKNLATTD